MYVVRATAYTGYETGLEIGLARFLVRGAHTHMG